MNLDITNHLIVIPRTMKRESGTVTNWIENLKVFDFFVVQPHSFQNGTSLTKRICSQSVFHIRLPRSRKLIIVFKFENTCAVFFIIYPKAFTMIVCDKQKSSFDFKNI